ncbi:MAG: hypothetical protein KIS66_05345 [Fimbriimonadaceae bacterium]|nr:hypothetical protein [Fimbriimonadaceae bacterium]
MVTCEICQTANSLDSKFCRNCGGAIPEAALHDALREHEKLVREGQKLVLEGRLDEAFAVAETAVAAHPGSRDAHALKASVHEQRQELGDAIECYERIVELDPDATIDKIKLNHLRNTLLLHDPVAEAERPRRRRALFAAAAAVVLVVAVGAAIGAVQSQMARNREPRLVMGPDEGKNATPFDTNLRNATDVAAPNPATGAPNPDVSAPSGTANPAPAPNGGQGNVSEPGRVVIDPRDRLPDVGNGGTGNGGDGGQRPIRVDPVPVNPNEGATGNTGNATRTDPPPVVVNPNPTAPPTRPPDDPGFIDIQVSRGTTTPPGTPVRTENRAQALLKAAQNQHQAGNLPQAALGYEKALEAGADSGRTNQQLASVYKSMGRKNDAVRAYRRAIQSYEGQIAQGGDRNRLALAIDVCNQEIANLGG